jgi:hypothetical protein
MGNSKGENVPAFQRVSVAASKRYIANRSRPWALRVMSSERWLLASATEILDIGMFLKRKDHKSHVDFFMISCGRFKIWLSFAGT